MAKRRKEKDEEDKKPFKIPKFDKEKFIKKEKLNIKSTFIAFLFGAFMSFICFGFWVLMGSETGLRWPLVVLVAIASASFVKYLYMRINLDTSHFTKKNWFSSYGIYFISWLIVFIVIVNPPVYDDQDPRIEMVVLPHMQEYNGTVKILAKITDNTEITKSDITFTLDDIKVSSDNYQYVDNIFRYTHQCPDNLTEEKTYSFELKAVDSSGRTTIKKDTFGFSNDTITLAEPENYEHIDVDDDIRFRIETTINRVYYTINNETEINATKGDREEYWVTYPEYEGWPDEFNKTVKIDVKAEIVYYFENYIDENGEFVPFSNTIVNNESYYFIIDDPDDIGEKTPVKTEMPQPKFVTVPGFETILFIISLIAVILIIKYKKKDKKN